MAKVTLLDRHQIAGGYEKFGPGIEPKFVTHADYRALEERYAETVEGAAQLGLQVVELTKELASLRGKVGELVEADRDSGEVVAYLRDLDGTGSLHIATKGDPGALPVCFCDPSA